MKNPAVDAYIAKAPPFAKPILAKIRALFHKACPDLDEKIKWSVPSFERGRIIGLMAAFKAHVRLVYWNRVAEKIATVAELPKDAVILEAIREAAAAPRPKKPRTAKPPLKVPPYLLARLRAKKNAFTAFQAFTPARRREYVDWIVEAKTEETRERRLAQAVEWISKGKTRYWRYGR